MKQGNTYCVIMAGGVGSRFWPMSRTSRPKQFLDILGVGRTLIQQTFDRFTSITSAENILVVTHADYEALVKEQLPELPVQNILTEPARKNTAPCAAYASYRIGASDPDATIVMAPSDHLIMKEDTFVRAIKSCVNKTREEDCLVTLGIKPTRPDTGYGYIQFEEGTGWSRDIRIKKVKTFTEKPDLEMAKSFLESGDFLWNSGIFIWTYKAISKAFADHLPDMAALFTEKPENYNTSLEKDMIRSIYGLCGNVSIDYGIMEEAPNVYVRASVIGWSDLGTWGSLYTHMEPDKQLNAVKGGDVMFYESEECFVRLPEGKLAVVQGMKDFIIVDSGDTLLICRKQDEQMIRTFVADVKEKYGDSRV